MPAAAAGGGAASAGDITKTATATGFGLIGALGGSGAGPLSTSTRFLNPADENALTAGQGRLDAATQDLNARSIDAADRANRGIGFLESGQLDPASRALISQGIDRDRRLAAARKVSLASQFGAGSNLAKILGSQNDLKADLNQNNLSFNAFRDQFDRQGSVQNLLTSMLGLRGQGVSGLNTSQAAQLNFAGLRGGINQSTQDQGNFFDRVGKVGEVAAGVGAGLQSPQSQAPYPGMVQVGGANSGNFVKPMWETRGLY